MVYDQKEYFTCYSPKLKDELIESGESVFAKFTHIKTEKICWVFKRNENVKKVLDSWSGLDCDSDLDF